MDSLLSWIRFWFARTGWLVPLGAVALAILVWGGLAPATNSRMLDLQQNVPSLPAVEITVPDYHSHYTEPFTPGAALESDPMAQDRLSAWSLQVGHWQFEFAEAQKINRVLLGVGFQPYIRTQKIADALWFGVFVGPVLSLEKLDELQKQLAAFPQLSSFGYKPVAYNLIQIFDAVESELQ